jgi:hypothetical protein
MDGDDVSFPERFKRQVAFLEKHPEIALVGTFVIRMDEQGNDGQVYRYMTEDADIKKHLWKDVPFLHSSVILRKDCLERVGDYRESLVPAADYDLWFRICEHFPVANIPEVLHKFRIDPAGISVAKKFDQLRAFELVRMLAEDRRRYGEDRLDRLTEKELKDILEERLPRTKQNEREVLSGSWIYLAEVSYCAGNYRRSAQWLKKLLIYKPLHSRGWLLFFKILLCTALSARRINQLKRLYRREPLLRHI